MASRTEAQEDYRFGFNGQERDDDFNGNYSFDYRIYNPRLGRFLSVDPLAAEYAYNSPYAFAEDKPILSVDLEGLELDPAKRVNENDSKSSDVSFSNSSQDSDQSADPRLAAVKRNTEEKVFKRHVQDAKTFADLTGGILSQSNSEDPLLRSRAYVDVSDTKYGLPGGSTLYIFDPGKDYSDYFKYTGGCANCAEAGFSFVYVGEQSKNPLIAAVTIGIAVTLFVIAHNNAPDLELTIPTYETFDYIRSTTQPLIDEMAKKIPSSESDYKEKNSHRKNARRSTRKRHEEGESRTKKDQGKEKGDKRRRRYK